MTATASPAVLTVNAGSSSIKAAVFDTTAGTPVRLSRAEVIGIRKQALLVTEDRGGSNSVPLPGVRNHADAMFPVLDWVTSMLDGRTPAAVGHRIVHGGDDYLGPVVAMPDILESLERLAPRAPMHQMTGLGAVRAMSRLLPDVPQVLSLDTAFHATMPPVARSFALPRELTADGIRRYGFHGLSYESVARQLPGHLGAAADGRVVIAHLGAGASLCALRAGHSVATTMGFTPLDGLPMGTRCGALDPGVVLHLLRERAMTVTEVEELLYNQSGLFGVSGVSGRMEFLLRAGTPAANEAIDLFIYRTAAEFAAMASALGGLDAMVFTAGIGEGSPEIRRRIAERCRWLGVELDDDANEAGGPRITIPASPVSAWVIATDEEAVIAEQALTVVRSLADPLPAPAAAVPGDDPMGEAVKTALRDVAPNVDLAGLDSDADLSVAADLDSIDYLAVIARVEERTGVDIPERDFPFCTTLGGMTAYVRNRALVRQP